MTFRRELVDYPRYRDGLQPEVLDELIKIIDRVRSQKNLIFSSERRDDISTLETLLEQYVLSLPLIQTKSVRNRELNDRTQRLKQIAEDVIKLLRMVRIPQQVKSSQNDLI